MILNLQKKISKVERKQKYKVTRKLFFIWANYEKKQYDKFYSTSLLCTTANLENSFGSFFTL